MNSSGGMPHHTLKRQAPSLNSSVVPHCTSTFADITRDHGDFDINEAVRGVITRVVRCGPSERTGLAQASPAEQIFAVCLPK